MKDICTYKYRLYPDAEQRVYLAKVFGCCRKVYNYFLNNKIEQYKSTKRSDNYNAQQAQLTHLRKDENFMYLQEVPLQTLQCSLRNMHTAFDRFYKKLGGYPKFKDRRNTQAFKIGQPNTFHIKDGKLFIPKLKSGIDIRVSRMIEGSICYAVIKKNKAGRYYVSITFKPSNQVIYKHTGNSVGIDVGIKDLAVTSDGIKYPNKHKVLKALKHKLKHNQRALSRKKYGSKNYENQVVKCNRIYEKITNVREDYLHKVSTELIKQYDTICVETLNVKGMLKNHKHAEVISECAWATFLNMLEYKCLWHDRTFVKIDKFFPSSQTCSNCGSINKEVKDLKIRAWKCKECGCEHDRDVNAAKNIHRQGVSITVVEPCNKPNEKQATADCSGGCEAINETTGEQA